jgi:hypothetical protein
MKTAFNIEKTQWLPRLIALIGGGVYFVQSWIYAHSQVSVLDEGLYLLKGYLFASGEYRPFQYYGPWTNHMPLSFLFPGYFQVWFGEGLRTGRYLSIGLGLLFLLGFWIIVHRFGGDWWATAAIWVIAINPAVIKIYSVMASQVLVACGLVWVFVFTLGEDRPTWEIILGSAIAALLPLIRLNMSPLLPLLWMYLIWEQGWKKGLGASSIGFLIFGLGHALYWPGIMRLWASWLPSSLTPFLDGWRRISGGQRVWNPQVSIEARVTSFFEGIRLHFVSFISILSGFSIWLSLMRKDQKVKEFKSLVFLSLLFVVLFGFHAWAALFNEYCVFCFSSYISFFGFIGFLIFVLAVSSWRENIEIYGKNWMWLVVVLISLGVGFSTHYTLSNKTLLDQIMEILFLFPLPRIKEGQIQSGTVPWLGLLSNILGWEYGEVLQRAKLVFFMVFAVLVGVIGTWIILWCFAKVNHIHRNQLKKIYPDKGFVLFAFLVLGLFLSPSAFLGGGRNTYDCNQDVIAIFEKNGAYLNEIIPPGSKVYWKGGLALSILTYLSDVNFYPAQFNNVYSYKIGGDPDELLKFGLWNEELSNLWLGDADYILVTERSYSDWIQTNLESGNLVELGPTSPLNPCKADTRIHVFRRIP